MPIRFRCVYCDKLLGIARRKAGTVVNCPHCAEKLIVPTPDPADEAAAAEEEAPTVKAEGRAVGEQLWEKSDFIDALLSPEPTFPTAEDAPAAPLPEPAWQNVPLKAAPFHQPFPAAQNLPQPTPPQVVGRAPPRPGFHVSPAKALWLSVLAVLLLAAAFGGGFLVGRTMNG